MLKSIIFDLGGVLIDWNPRYVFKKYFETTEGMEYFFQKVCTFDWNEQQDAGRKIAKANELLLEQFPEYETEIIAFYGQWEDMLGGSIDGTLSILSALHQKDQYQLYALTNWSSETFPIALSRYSFLEWFDGILVSGEENIKKPDPKIYQLLLSRFKLNNKECIFIDDNLRNVEAARKQGIISIHFVNPEQLGMELRKQGIEI